MVGPEAGVRAALLIDPTDRSIALMRPGPTIVMLGAGDRLDLDEIIPGLRLDIGALFDELKD